MMVTNRNGGYAEHTRLPLANFSAKFVYDELSMSAHKLFADFAGPRTFRLEPLEGLCNINIETLNNLRTQCVLINIVG